jgi:hypothetical protein
MNKDENIGAGLIRFPKCAECDRIMWGLAKVWETHGVEKPIYLHAECWRKLKEYKYMYEGLDK